MALEDDERGSISRLGTSKTMRPCWGSCVRFGAHTGLALPSPSTLASTGMGTASGAPPAVWLPDDDVGDDATAKL